jgi:hypothetical protein
MYVKVFTTAAFASKVPQPDPLPASSPAAGKPDMPLAPSGRPDVSSPTSGKPDVSSPTSARPDVSSLLTSGKPDVSSLPTSGKPDVGGAQRERSESVAQPAPESSSQEKPSYGDLGARRGRTLTPVPVVPALIPLVHAPDDPGPDHEHVESEPEPTAEPPPDSWSRIRQLFRP